MNDYGLVILHIYRKHWGITWWQCIELICQCRGCGLDPWPGKIPHASKQLSWSTTLVGSAPEPVCTTVWAPQQEKPPQWKVLTLQQKVDPAHHNQRKLMCGNKNSVQAK